MKENVFRKSVPDALEYRPPPMHTFELLGSMRRTSIRPSSSHWHKHTAGRCFFTLGLSRPANSFIELPPHAHLH
eukprot:5282287-Amphidinium_carterae.1